MERYTMIIEVVGEEGEQNLSIHEVSDCDLESLQPLLEDIRWHRGYFPTGKFLKPGEPTPRELYRHHMGWQSFITLIPDPPSGILGVVRIRLWKEEPLTMHLL